MTARARGARRAHALAVLTLALCTTLPTSRARAADDGVYGRFDGDVELGLAAGAGIGQGGPQLVAEASAVYLGTAGLYAHYADALGASLPRTGRSFAVGVVVRPLFLGRYANDYERGPARLDLFLDSAALELGAVFRAPTAGSLQATPGLEIALEVAVPVFATASGPSVALRGALRLQHDDLAGRGTGDLADKGALLSLTFGWRQIIAAHIVDPCDRASR